MSTEKKPIKTNKNQKKPIKAKKNTSHGFFEFWPAFCQPCVFPTQKGPEKPFLAKENFNNYRNV